MFQQPTGWPHPSLPLVHAHNHTRWRTPHATSAPRPADRVYVAVTEDENVGAFVEALQRKLAAHAAAAASEAGGGVLAAPSKSMADLAAAAGVGAGGLADEMPFELRVMEAALDAVCVEGVG